MKNQSMARILFNAMNFTKRNMLTAYKERNDLTIEEEYTDFRTFTRFLMIRGNAHVSYDFRVYVNEEMKAYKEMLLEQGADWRK